MSGAYMKLHKESDEVKGLKQKLQSRLKNIGTYALDSRAVKS